jgi:hypothetical protein
LVDPDVTNALLRRREPVVSTAEEELMKHLSNLSQNVRVFMAAVALSVGAAGCASGGSDGTGTAGSGTAGGGGGGASGASGACSLADVNKIFATPAKAITPGCTGALACHDNKGSAAGLDLVSEGWQNKLVGMGPSAAAASAPIPTLCAGMGPYLVAGSNPAKGLFMDKIDPTTTTAPCGVHMPYLQANITTQQFACIQSWATTLTNP